MIRTTLSLALVAFAYVLAAASADAASNRTFVSGLGNDANPCSLAQPCRTLQAAFNVTAPNGEIDVLDPTGYGSLNITHSVSIQGHGWASLNSASSGVVVLISAGALDTIHLRGLILEGLGTSIAGIDVATAGTVEVIDCDIHNFNGDGIVVHNVSGSTVLNSLLISKSHISDNQSNGISIGGTTGLTFNVTIADSVVSSNGKNNSEEGGMFVDGDGGTVHVTVSTSLFASNSGVGILGRATGGGISTVMVRDSVVDDNSGSGLFSGPGNESHVTRSTFKGNNIGLDPEGGSIFSYGDNHVFDNTSNGGPTSTISGL